MTVQDTKESYRDLIAEFDRRHTLPGCTLWNGMQVNAMKHSKSYSHHIDSLNSQDLSETDQRMLSFDNVRQQERHPNLTRTVYKTAEVDDQQIPYAYKESSVNKELQRYLLKTLKSKRDEAVHLLDYEEAFVRVCYESFDAIFVDSKEKAVTDLVQLVDNSIQEAKRRIFEEGVILSPIRERLSLLKKLATRYIQDVIKQRSLWTDELITELSLIIEYLNTSRKTVKGENRVGFFLNFMENKIKDSDIYGIISKAIQPAKGKTSKLIKALRDIDENKIEETVKSYYYQRIELTQKASRVIEWNETDSSSCKLSIINREGMLSSLIRDYVNTRSSFSINGALIDVGSLLHLPSEEEQMKGFFEKIGEELFQNTIEREDAVNNLLQHAPSVLDPVLWSCSFHAWANPEILLQKKFEPLIQKGYVVLQEPATECSIEADQNLQTYSIDIRRKFCIYPTDIATGIKDESQPILSFICFWNYKPQNIANQNRWTGIMQFENLNFKEPIPLKFRDEITNLLLKTFTD